MLVPAETVRYVVVIFIVVATHSRALRATKYCHLYAQHLHFNAASSCSCTSSSFSSASSSLTRVVYRFLLLFPFIYLSTQVTYDKQSNNNNFSLKKKTKIITTTTVKTATILPCIKLIAATATEKCLNPQPNVCIYTHTHIHTCAHTFPCNLHVNEANENRRITQIAK